MFTEKTDEEMIEILRCCLNGLTEQTDANYATENRSLILMVATEEHYVAIYAKGMLLFRLDYENDNLQWKESEIGEGTDFTAFSEAVILIYQEELERRGEHVIRDKSKKYLN